MLGVVTWQLLGITLLPQERTRSGKVQGRFLRGEKGGGGGRGEDCAAGAVFACQASLSFTISRSLLKLMSIESVMPSNHLILFLPLFFSSISVFSNESSLCIRWPKYWSFSFSISLSKEYSGLISFRINRFALVWKCL